MKIKYDEIDTPIGVLTLGWSGEGEAQGLCNIEFGAFADVEAKLREWSKRWYGTAEWEHDPDALAEVAEQLRDYFAGRRKSFELPLDLRGTPFQVKVWRALLEVPYGKAWSYKDIAERIGSPKAVRAVGGSNNRNPVAIIVPCHRVIGSSGALVGYGGGLHVKTFLLEHEGCLLKGGTS
ncbi:methylated-DNA--[protein]-cysteine S-methyltransferase [Paenibacillus cremeus]|uniref:Methylated-DNA--protein-cysteine methyltransferase n=1 Tax=Paenibacillus cremeus TaxID=2163881 RepID=A0A559KDI6_9BACL|nr:methylated-DNA--[protein]-cysteine S-methyltransferase [Paenibacillus cremeus]TVY10190.1 methylated-DNA--[protein]-cysteine S-methyltransferase [Paenibacillus cremeus]